jgi:hypothetical protein
VNKRMYGCAMPILWAFVRLLGKFCVLPHNLKPSKYQLIQQWWGARDEKKVLIHFQLERMDFHFSAIYFVFVPKNVREYANWKKTKL